jgi:hypothetical protein
MTDSSQKSAPPSLDEQLARLPLDIAPPAQLWPRIAARLTPSPRRSRPVLFAVAAALGCACVASALTWSVLRGRAAPEAPQIARHAPGFDEPRDPHYIAARDSLESAFRQRLALLDPATRVKIESSLAVIRQAHEDIRKALASDPASPVLEQLWQSTWHDELDLYEHVVEATQSTLTRT